MKESFLKYALLTALLYLLVGCARDIAVELSLPQPTSVTQGALLATVTVNDLRKPGIAASKREAAFGVPMGNITFDPSEVQLVKETLELELTKLLQERGIQAKQVYECDMVELGVNTITTPLYWDVIGRIRFVLKHSGREYNLAGTHTERTYVWPGEALIKKVIEESLQQVVAGLRPAVQAG